MFQVKPFESKTLSWWFHEREKIDLDPIYQRRGGIWSKKDKAYLIDSILNGFDIPKIYIADFTYTSPPGRDKKKYYAVIDGKQRFEAIFDFFSGKLALDAEFSYFDDPSLRLGDMTYKDLKDQQPKLASRFEVFNLSVMSVITDEDNKINDLFIRLNKSRPLTGSEIRGAMQGLVPKLIKRISQHAFFETKTRFSVKRKQDENAAGKLLLLEFRSGFVDTKGIDLDRFVEEGAKSEAPVADFERVAQRTMKVLDMMDAVFMAEDPLLKTSSSIPLYYWLFRTYAKNHQQCLRDFIEYFEKKRSGNRKGSAYDRELADYDMALRHVNDQGSLVKCYTIFEKRFFEFLRGRNI